MSFAGNKILIVDDEPDLRDMLAFEFRSQKALVLEAENGQAALATILKEQDIHVVLTDIRMPNGNGVDLLRESKKLNSNHPVFVIVTAYSDVSREILFDLGAECIFSKPFDLSLLISSVSRVQKKIQERFLEEIKADQISEKIKIEEKSKIEEKVEAKSEDSLISTLLNKSIN